MHVAITKERLLRDIRRFGPKNVLAIPHLTMGDALGMIGGDPREVFTFGDCDNYDELGHCLGHRSREDGGT